MTSAEFAATYRVLKTLTEQGARSRIAQEVALGRMVMVHTLDVGSAIDRQRLRAAVGALQPAAAEQVLGVHDVDGTTMVVTRFLTTFTDLPSWVRDNATVDDAKTLVIAAVPTAPTVPSPPAAPAQAVPSATVPPRTTDAGFTAIFTPAAVATPDTTAPKPPAPSFTEMFGAVKDSSTPPPPPPSSGSAPTVVPGTSQAGDFTRQFVAKSPLGPVAPPPAAALGTASVAPGAPAAPAAKAGASFTQMFGGVTSTPAPTPAAVTPPAPTPPTTSTPATQQSAATPPAAPRNAAPSPTPPASAAKGGESFTQVFGSMAASQPPPAPLPAAPQFDSVIPPQAPEAPRLQPATPPPPKKSSGEFTQLFDRLTPGMSAPAQPRPQAPPAAAQVVPPAAPTPSWSEPASPPASTPPAPTWQSPPAPTLAGGGAGSPASGPSEFTRILGKVTAPDAAAASRASGESSPGAAFQMPQMPQMPQLPQLPQLPQMPQAPQMIAPAMQLPQMQLPLAPLAAAALTPLSVPQQSAGAGAAPTRSHLPLIIALNVVLVAAIGVVIYFVLKH
jgi:hypothetical protein